MKKLLTITACLLTLTPLMFGQFKDTSKAIDSIAARNLLWVPFDEPTIGVQALCGIGFTGIGVAIGIAASPKGGDASGVQSGIALMLGTVIAAVGLPVGTYLGGTWMGGNGSWWSTFGGCIAGGCLGLVPNIFFKYNDAGVAAVVFGIAAVAGGIAGYHLSASPVSQANGTGTSSLWPNQNVEQNIHASSFDVYSQNVQIRIISIRL